MPFPALATSVHFLIVNQFSYLEHRSTFSVRRRPARSQFEFHSGISVGNFRKSPVRFHRRRSAARKHFQHIMI